MRPLVERGCPGDLSEARDTASPALEVMVWQDRATQGKLSKLQLLSIGWVVATGIILFPLLSLAAEDSALDDLQAYWIVQAPWCPFHSPSNDAPQKPVLKEFASKNEDGAGSNTPPCNDGDSIMFNGLLCLAGVKAGPSEDKPEAAEIDAVRQVGCDVVKHSQTLKEGSADYGRWWRSPRRNYLAPLNQQWFRNYFQQRSCSGRYGIYRPNNGRRSISGLDELDKKQGRDLQVFLVYPRVAALLP